MVFKPLRFIGAAVEVEFDTPPIFEKRPNCPDRFIWDAQPHRIVELISQWQDYQRRGRMARNMAPAHAAAAAERGSWGVGRIYFRVRIETGQVFDLYYDRAPGTSAERKGFWLLFQELQEAPE